MRGETGGRSNRHRLAAVRTFNPGSALQRGTYPARSVVGWAVSKCASSDTPFAAGVRLRWNVGTQPASRVNPPPPSKFGRPIGPRIMLPDLLPAWHAAVPARSAASRPYHVARLLPLPAYGRLRGRVGVSGRSHRAKRRVTPPHLARFASGER